jgi:hypothetical protein
MPDCARESAVEARSARNPYRASARVSPQTPQGLTQWCLSRRDNELGPKVRRGPRCEANRRQASGSSHRRVGASMLKEDRLYIRGLNSWHTRGRRECPRESVRDSSPVSRSPIGLLRAVRESVRRRGESLGPLACPQVLPGRRRCARKAALPQYTEGQPHPLRALAWWRLTLSYKASSNTFSPPARRPIPAHTQWPSGIP